MEIAEIENILLNCELFGKLESEEIAAVAEICRVENFQAGEAIFRQGDLGEDLYIIAEGHVSLERTTDLGVKKGSVVISMLGKGRALGCWSTLLDDAHNLMSSAVCRKETRVVVVNGTVLRGMMRSNRSLGLNVLERLCFLLRDRIQGAYGAMEKI